MRCLKYFIEYFLSFPRVQNFLDKLGIPVFCCVIKLSSGAGIAQSVQRLATGWSVRGSNPGRDEIFRTRPNRPWGSPRLLCNEYRVSPGAKRPRRDADHALPSSAEVERVYTYTSTALWIFESVMGYLYLLLCLLIFVVSKINTLPRHLFPDFIGLLDMIHTH
jgi:hypothetical protein